MLRIAFLSHTPLPFPAVHATATLLTLLSLAAPAPATAAPVDPVVRNGVVSFAVNGNVFTVTNSPGAIIDWRQFNVANGELMRFLQQNAQSTVLNRVTGNDPSQILGALQSNGRVLLVNPNGVLFGANATVDVAGLVVSGLRLSDADFLAGKYNFAGGNGAVGNLGTITTPLGGSVYLIGSDVANSGVIRAPGGQILLAAGHSVSLADSGAPNLSVTLSASGNQARNLGELNAAGGRIDIYGALVDQQGSVRADSSGVDAQGRVVLKASERVTLSGSVSAASADGVGGTVQVLGDQVTLSDSARIDASGALGGGTVLVGGDYQGKNAAVQNATTTTVAAGASIDASARERGDGGKVVVWADGHTDFLGSIAARGGLLGGDGGLVETSGHTLVASGRVNTLAPRGKTGNWLLDPAVFCFYVNSASECTGAAAAGATDIDTLGNILTTSNGILNATDFITFLPAGGNATVDPAIPAGTLLNVQAPYINIGVGADIRTNQVAVKLDASSAYGNTTQVFAPSGASLTGGILIEGYLESNASQTLLSNGWGTFISATQTNAGVNMTSATGTQVFSGTGLELRTFTDQPRNATVQSSGAQSINVGTLYLQGDTYSNASILGGGSQTIAATDINILGRSGIHNNGDNGTQTIQASTINVQAGDEGTFNNAYISASGVNAVQAVSATKSLSVTAGAGGEGNYAQIRVDGGASQASAVQRITGGAIVVKGGTSSSSDDTRGNNASLDSAGTQIISADSIALQGGSNTVDVRNYGASHAFIGNGTGAQTINATGAITLTGGSGVGNAHTNIYTYGNQTISAETISGHAGNSGINNSVDISIYHDTSKAPVPDLVQTITANAILLQGGDSGTSNSARLSINGSGTRQNINAGSLSLTGGAGGEDNRVSISLFDDTSKTSNVQTVKASQITITGGAGRDNNGAIDSNGMQVITADSLTMRSGSGANSAAALNAGLDQTVAVTNTLALTGGSANGNGYSTANFNAVRDQTVRAATLMMTGGASGSNNGTDITSSGNQTITVQSLILQGGAGGTNNYANINAYGNSIGRVQKIDADSISLQGGSGTNNSVAMNANNADVVQQVSASRLSLTGGSGSGNRASLQLYRDGSTQVVNQIIDVGTLSLTGGNGIDSNAYVGGNGYQTIRADRLFMTGGGLGQNTGATVGSGFDQTVVVKNAIIMQGGGGAGVAGASNAGEASFYSGGNQSITAAELSMTGGASGSQNGATVNSNGNQTINVQKLLVQGGAGGDNNGANISLFDGAGHTQRITATESMTLRGGTNGVSNFAGTHASGASSVQLITTPNLTIAGGSGGSDNWAHLWASDDSANPLTPTQTVTAGAIHVIGGSALNNAMIGGNANQTFLADTLALQGGSGGRGHAMISTGQTQYQDFTVRGAMTLSGGSSTASDASLSTSAIINGGSQRIIADSLALTGGAVGSRNTASMYADISQVIDLKGGLTVRGGAGGENNGAYASAGVSQSITAQSVVVAGGIGARSNAFLDAASDVGVGEQSISAVNISVSGGGARSIGDIYAAGRQTITASSTLAITGGSGNGAFAEVEGHNQTISANRIVLSGGSGADTPVYISNYEGAQSVNLNGAGSLLSLTGGNGSNGAGSGAYLNQTADGGAQKITINGGGSVLLRGGSGNGDTAATEAGYCAGCVVTGNVAAIYAIGGGNQTLDFTAGGLLNLTGGSNGAGNGAVILADLSKGAQQAITSSGGAVNYPSITLTGGSGGFFNPTDGAAMTNNAAIASYSQLMAGPASSLKTINAKSITLNGGGSATTHGGALLGTGQGDAVINVTGDLIMTGGASSLPLLAATDPANAYSRDQGAIAAINPDGNLQLNVGGNLLMQGGSGTTSGALIDANSATGKVTLAVAGATRMLAGASSAAILSHTTTASTDPSGGAVVVDLGNDGAFTTSTFSSSGKSFRLKGTLAASGANANAPLLPIYGANSDAPDWQVLGAKDLQAGIYASDSYINDGEIVTPNGNWLVALGKTAAADSATAITYAALTAHGYQWTPTAFDSGNATDFRFLLPGDAPVVDLRAADNIANATCVTNAAMCATPGVTNGAALAAAPAAVTYDVQLNVADGPPPATPASAAATASEDTPAGGVATAQVGINGKRAATREKEEAQAADDKKTNAELKQEARVASTEAKANMAAVRKVELAAKKEAGAARAAAVAAAKEEAQAKRAETTAQRADADLKLVASDVVKAEADVRGAATPVLKLAAQARKADLDARRAGLQAKLADASAKKAEAGARRSEAQAKGADADALGADAGARALAAEAKLAEAARSEALVQAREAKSPQQRAAAERLAEDKRVDASQKSAESRVRSALAEDLRAAASQGKVQAEARRAQAQADVLEAQARRDESQLQAATARSHQEEAAAQRAIAGGRPELAKAAQARKAGLDRQLVAQTRKADARKAAAAAKAEDAKAEQAKADQAAVQVAQRNDARRQRALQAFAATATAAMSGDQLAERAVLRHAYKTEVFKEALTILARNQHAADLPVCAGGAVSVCVPAPVQLQAQLQGQAAQAGKPPLRLPSASFLPQIERKVALVIGINNYRDPRIVPLDSAVPDADAVAALMAERMGYEVRVLRDATRADIVDGIASLARELGPKDSVTVYYAGHGYMTGNTNGGQQGYWIPADAASNNPAKWISTNDVGRLLAAIPASQVMLVSDSCYSGTFAREQQVTAGADAGQILARRSVVVMSSGGEEPVADDGVDGHSIFAWSLMQALRQVDRYDTGARVFDATKSKVTAAYPQVPRYGAAVSAGHASGGDYLFEARSYK